MEMADIPSVSRETFGRLVTYHDLLLRWTDSINLIADSTKADAWTRHIVDSLQVFDLIPAAARTLTDIGSGGGLPGLVIAILAEDQRPDLKVTLIESDQRKAAFLRTVVRDLGLDTIVSSSRIEAFAGPCCDVLTARALAPLDRLLGFATSLLDNHGVAFFSKGRRFAAEIADAQHDWLFAVNEHSSITDPEARILEIKDIRRAAN